ncbi:hypothetical protein Poly41_01870 [Novipirellula artificiosorum]|uniref:Uncharacterized protein n=1 Tax=Novipirellula artificiosorum TaxID=2528016 RepID=A0A5C6E083_9BACT|nr:hypothetical protein Poly41_01870 [Novipirellula artificiosorum]
METVLESPEVLTTFATAPTLSFNRDKALGTRPARVKLGKPESLCGPTDLRSILASAVADPNSKRLAPIVSLA